MHASSFAVHCCVSILHARSRSAAALVSSCPPVAPTAVATTWASSPYPHAEQRISHHLPVHFVTMSRTKWRQSRDAGSTRIQRNNDQTCPNRPNESGYYVKIVPGALQPKTADTQTHTHKHSTYCGGDHDGFQCLLQRACVLHEADCHVMLKPHTPSVPMVRTMVVAAVVPLKKDSTECLCTLLYKA